MSDPNALVSVFASPDVTEAHLVKNLLLDEGIEASVSEEHEFLSLPITPSHVLVRQADQPRAKAIVDRYDKEQERRADRPDWVCAKCGATVVGAFDLCDACGADRPGTEEEDMDE